MASRGRKLVLGAAAAALLATTGAQSAAIAQRVGSNHAAEATTHLRVAIVSSRADLVSGGEALATMTLPTGASASTLQVSLNGHDVSRSFARRSNGAVEGVLTGLRVGRNIVVARSHGETARLRVTNHRRGGPLFSGPQTQPWTCEAHSDTRCNRRPQYSYFYLPTDGDALQPYDAGSPPPPGDVASTTTTDGTSVPFIVRRETGYIDRSEYAIATLFRPGQRWTPWRPQPQSNRRLVITHGHGCDTYYESFGAPAVLDQKLLGAGFILMSNGLDSAGRNCDVVTEAESLVMTKSYLITHYGPVEYTIGTGCSGGAITQQQVANAYPGIYQGLTPGCSYPDAWTMLMQYDDYAALTSYFNDPSRWGVGISWSPAAIRAVLDNPDDGDQTAFHVIANSADPSRPCPGIPADQIYDATKRPHGVRCTLQDYMVNVFGRAKSGKARRPLGDLGVQYGLQALADGTLTPAQFVDVNRAVGGVSNDDTFRADRDGASTVAVMRAYRSGAVDSASNLNRVAIIDLRGPNNGTFHDSYRTYALRDRLVAQFGTSANQVIWRGGATNEGDPSFADDAVFAMKEWLDAVKADHRAVGDPQKIIADRPSDVTDRCTDGAGQDVPLGDCDGLVPVYGSPRIGAGMPLADDIVKCQLTPLKRSAYPVELTDDEWAALQATFPSGVCNYDQPGVGQRDTVPWLTSRGHNGKPTYGGKPLGPAPHSVLVTR
jgi:hypothetical protein